MDNCIFCKIVSGQAPARMVYEDPYTVVFMDIAQDVDGHMVAVPRKHVNSILDCDKDTLFHLMNAVKTVSCRCVERLDYEGVNLLNASEECAGQSVPHFHIHIIPRKRADGVDAWPVFPGAKEDISEVYNKLINIRRMDNETL